MVLFNHSTRELTAKIVYYGPGLCGKTTNLRVLHERLEKGTAGRLLSLATAQDRTIYFDLLPVELGNIKGYTVRFQLCTVPGQVFYNETRKLVLRGVDGVVFVVDSQWSMVSHNLESWQNLVENLRDLSVGIESLPVVVQYNKRDLPGVLTVDALQESLGFPSYPFVEAVASTGQGVVETFKLVSKLTFVDLLRRLQRSGGIESDVFSVPTKSAAAHAADETSVRGGPPAKRSSFAVPAPVAEPDPTPDPVPEPVGAFTEKEQPFDAGPGWIPANDTDVFSATNPVSNPAAPTPAEPEPFAAAEPAPAPQAVAIEGDVIEMPEAPVPVAPSAPAAPESHPVPAATDPALRAGLDRHDAALAELRSELDSLRAELGALRESQQGARAELGASVETLAATIHERLGSVGADLFAARAEAERARGELAEAHRALAERVEALAADESRAGIAQRVEAAEQEIARSRAVVEEAHRHIDERLGAAERRTRSLADSIRKALEELN